MSFDKIKQQVTVFILTERAIRFVESMTPQTDIEKLTQLQSETAQSLAILQQGKYMPIPKLSQLDSAIKRLQLEASLNAKELAQIGKLLSTVEQLVKFFDQMSKEDKVYPALSVWVNKCVSLPPLLKLIHVSISEDGQVLSTASEKLAKIRRSQAQTEEQIRQTLNELLKSKAAQLSDALITIRNDRYVLPVKAEYRQSFGGTVHDQSATGQTVYIEPQAVVSLNNQRSTLQAQERIEIERILYELSVELMPYWQDIEQNEWLVAQLDFIQARANYAKATRATRPKFSTDQFVRIYQARHPLLDERHVVANDIMLGQDYKSLIITGPNTGGKTILIKTLGLLQLMGQSGLHIPAEEGSQLGVFDRIYADIGDEQSIEQNLSTFSSHMTNIIRIVNEASYQSLVLFDELGSGTDPQEGAQLAMAILNYFRKIDATVLATTHYPELKVYAHETPNTINASMEFDVKTLSPTYRLLIGVPGRSNAFDISKRLGLRDDILEEARSGISQDSQSLNDMVSKLESERREVEQKMRETEQQLDEATQLHADLRLEYNRWLEQKEKLVEKAKRDANEKVNEAELQAQKIIQEIRDLQLEQGQNKTIKEHVLIDKRRAFDNLKMPENLKKNKVLKKAKINRQLKVGDDVEVLSYGQRGTIMEIGKSGHYIVQMGILKMKFERDDLNPLEKVENHTVKVNVQRQAGSKVMTTLDLRGERYEQAIYRLNQYIDAALLSNHPMVTIIHGKGTGALRDGVKQTLKNNPQVDHFEYSPPNAGGDGSTVVYFK